MVPSHYLNICWFIHQTFQWNYTSLINENVFGSAMLVRNGQATQIGVPRIQVDVSYELWINYFDMFQLKRFCYCLIFIYSIWYISSNDVFWSGHIWNYFDHCEYLCVQLFQHYCGKATCSDQLFQNWVKLFTPCMLVHFLAHQFEMGWSVSMI